jgi:hypothetical protein
LTTYFLLVIIGSDMDKQKMLQAFAALDQHLTSPTRIIVGGGAALVAAHGIPISTYDVDGVPDRSSMEFAAFQKEVRAVGTALKIAPNWLNDHFSAFLYVLPPDYGQRLLPLYQGRHLTVCALAKEELILMKCFAGREKDLPHARALLRQGVANLKIIDHRIQELLEKKIPGADRAADFFDDLLEEMGLAL